MLKVFLNTNQALNAKTTCKITEKELIFIKILKNAKWFLKANFEGW
jgi:hypothetical protein